MKILFILALMVSIEAPFFSYLPEQPDCKPDTVESEVSNTEFARVYFDSPSSEDGGITRSLLHEFDCSVPKWQKDSPITAIELSGQIELVLYEHKKYRGDHQVLNHLNNGSLEGIPEKFSTPGSVKLLYKGKEDCISSINQDPEDAISYIFVEDQITGGLNEMPDEVPHRLYMTNRHANKSISVRYKLNGRVQNILTVKLEPEERKSIIGYVLRNPKTIILLNARFLDE